MRKIYSTLVLSAMAFSLFCGCNKMIECPAESVISTSSFWKTESDAKAGLNGAYLRFRNVFESNALFNYGDMRTGFYGSNLNNGYATYGNMWDNQLDPTTTGTDWGSFYTCINGCNLILSHVPSIKFSNDSDKNNILGQARFLRAYCYYMIARIWGDAPIMLVPVESDDETILFPSRAAVEDVLKVVEDDITNAVGLLGNSNGVCKANKSSAYLFYADFCLWQAKVNKKTDYLAKAEKAITDFKSSTKAVLSDSYVEVFRNDNNNEIVFSIPFIQNENEKSGTVFLNLVSTVDAVDVNNPIPVGSQTQWMIITDKHRAFLHEIESDTRADINAMCVTGQNGTVYKWVDKYQGTWANGTRYLDSDYRIYRYADAIMLDAEIKNEQGKQTEAIVAVNQIAKRAYGVDKYYSGTYTKDQITEILANETIKEFATEGKVWFSLIRLGKAFDKIETLKGKETKQGILLWPVSNSSINNNPNIKQTIGY